MRAKSALGLMALVALSAGGPVGSAAQWPEDTLLVPIGRDRISAVYDLDAAPPNAYALERQNLRVLDVSDPGAVREVASLPFEGPRLRAELHGSHLYLVGGQQPLGVVEVGNPAEPRWLGELGDVSETIGARRQDDVLWVLRQPRRLALEAFDLRTDPGRPRRLATLELDVDLTAPLPAVGLAADSGRLFVLVNPPTGERNRIVVVDAEDPRSPAVVRTVALPAGEQFNDLVVRGDLVYLLRRDPDGLAIFRMHEDGAPEALGSVTDPRLWFGADMMLRGDAVHASFKGEIMLATFDVADPMRPVLVHAFVPEGFAAAGLGFSIVGDRLYLSGDYGPSPVFDVGDPRSPEILGRWDYEGGWAADVLPLASGALAVLNRWFGIYVLDPGDPRRPRRLSRHFDAAHDHVAVASHGDRVLVTKDDAVVELLDLTDPSAPASIRQIVPTGFVSVAALSASHALLAVAGGRLEVIDLESPAAPRGNVELPATILDIAASDDRAVVLHAAGLAVVDLTDPARPRLAALSDSRDGADPANAVTGEVAWTASGDHAVTTVGELRDGSGVVVVAVHALAVEAGIRELGRLEIDADLPERLPVVVSSDEALVAIGTRLLRIDIQDPEGPRVASSYRLKMSMDAEGLARSGRFVHVGAGEDGFLVFELPDHDREADRSGRGR